MDMSLSKLLEMMKNREDFCVLVCGVARIQTWLNDWTTTTWMSSFTRTTYWKGNLSWAELLLCFSQKSVWHICIYSGFSFLLHWFVCLYIGQCRNAKKAKWLAGEALQIAVRRRKTKSKGEKKRYKHLNAEFQRIARRDKKAFFSDQCKEIGKKQQNGKD